MMSLESDAPWPSAGPAPGSAREFVRAVAMRGAADDVDERLAAVELLRSRVHAGLTRWFGAFGTVALVNRALPRAQLDHPSLADVSLSTESTPRRMGVAAGESTHGSQATADGVVAMLMALADLVARLIGDDLAINLLQQSISVSTLRTSAIEASTDEPVTEPARSVRAAAASGETSVAHEQGIEQ